jgi:hypothetical protein
MAPIGAAGLLAVSAYGAWQSSNGWDWTTLDAPVTEGSPHAVTLHGDVIVSVGERWSESGGRYVWIAAAIPN